MSSFPDLRGKTPAEIMALLDQQIEQMATTYILDENKQPKKVPFSEYIQYRMQHGEEGFRVAITYINDDLHVSTVFLGQGSISLSQHLSRELPMFESMIFATGDWKDMDTRACKFYTWDEAMKGHEEIVATLRKMAKPARQIAKPQT